MLFQLAVLLQSKKNVVAVYTFFYCLCCCLDLVILKIVAFIISLWFIFCVFLRSVVDVGDIHVVLHVVYCYNERTQLLFIIFSVVVVGI